MSNLSSDAKSRGVTHAAMPRVLIADPSTLVIERLAASIDDVAHVVGHATNAQDAITLIHSGNPHLTVFDVAIDQGVRLLRYIKTRQPPVIAIILTHSAEDTTRRYCIRLGAEYFLDKLREFDKVREIVIAFGSGWGRGNLGPPAPR